MSYFRAPVIVTFLGVPGSGKSYFARQAAGRMSAVRLNSDAMRLSIFGSIAKARELYQSKDRAVLNSYVFGAMDYAAEQILSQNIDVLYDANSNRRSDRETAEKIAHKHKAVAILVRIVTPRDVAVQRGQDREDAPDSPRKTEAEMHDVIDRMSANIQEPNASENTVEISGQAPFEEQFIEFESRVREVIDSNG